MNFDDFKELVAEHFEVSVDDAMEELDRTFPEDMFVIELLDTGSVTVSLDERRFVLKLSVEEIK